MDTQPSSHRIALPRTRREFLRTAGLAGGLALFAPAALAACSSTPSGGAASVQKSGSAAPAASSASGATARPLAYATDAALGPMLGPYITKFNSEYTPLSAKLDLLATYLPTVQAQLSGGTTSIDMLFSDQGYSQTWYDRGWIKALDGLPDLDKINNDFSMPSLKSELFASDGKQIAIPYYSGLWLFAYNKELLGKIDAKPPTTWDEMTSACAELKKAGIDTPFAPFWDKDFNLVSYSFFATCASEGMKSAFSGDSSAPTFHKDPVAQEVLNKWQQWFKSGYVSSDVLSSSYTTVSSLFSAGKSAFSMNTTQTIKPWSTAKGTASAGNTMIAPMPGSEGATLATMVCYHMAAKTPYPDQAWELMKFLGWQDSKADNAYTTPLGYVVQGFGLTAPYKGLLALPQTKEAMSFIDNDIWTEQSKKSVNLLYPADRTTWFASFITNMSTVLQQAIIGNLSVTDALNQAAAAAKQQS